MLETSQTPANPFCHRTEAKVTSLTVNSYTEHESYGQFRRAYGMRRVNPQAYLRSCGQISPDNGFVATMTEVRGVRRVRLLLEQVGKKEVKMALEQLGKWELLAAIRRRSNRCQKAWGITDGCSEGRAVGGKKPIHPDSGAPEGSPEVPQHISQN